MLVYCIFQLLSSAAAILRAKIHIDWLNANINCGCEKCFITLGDMIKCISYAIMIVKDVG